MDQEVAVIAQHPLALFIAFDARRQFSAPFELLAYFVGDGLILARVRARADHKIIGKAGDAGEIQNSDVGGLLFLGGANCDAPPGFGLMCGSSTVSNVSFDPRQKLAPNRYRTME